MEHSKKTTIKDVAREANVSISVVSYVLNRSTQKTISDATKERVLQAAQKLNYIPNRKASGMRNNKSLSIGIVSYWEMDGIVYMEMVKGISQVAAAHHYSVTICNRKSTKDHGSYIHYFLDGTIDGIILISPHEALGGINESAHIHTMKEVKVPFVIMNGHTNEKDVRYINIDFYDSTYRATLYLIRQGYEKVTYVAPMDLPYEELHQRYLGYLDAVRQNKLNAYICDVKEIEENIKDFRAVVTNKSDTAHKVMQEALRQKLIIPQDFVMIAGNTEAYSKYLFPPLSTVRIPAEEMGELAMKSLLSLIQGRREEGSMKLPCSLQIRGSC